MSEKRECPAGRPFYWTLPVLEEGAAHGFRHKDDSSPCHADASCFPDGWKCALGRATFEDEDGLYWHDCDDDHPHTRCHGVLCPEKLPSAQQRKAGEPERREGLEHLDGTRRRYVMPGPTSGMQVGPVSHINRRHATQDRRQKAQSEPAQATTTLTAEQGPMLVQHGGGHPKEHQRRNRIDPPFKPRYDAVYFNGVVQLEGSGDADGGYQEEHQTHGDSIGVDATGEKQYERHKQQRCWCGRQLMRNGNCPVANHTSASHDIGRDRSVTDDGLGDAGGSESPSASVPPGAEHPGSPELSSYDTALHMHISKGLQDGRIAQDEAHWLNNQLWVAREEVEQLRALVRRFSVDEIGSYIIDNIQDGGPIWCDLCGEETWEGRIETANHGPGCPVTAARQLGIVEEG